MESLTTSELVVLRQALRHFGTYAPIVPGDNKRTTYRTSEWLDFKKQYSKDILNLDKRVTTLLSERLD